MFTIFEKGDKLTINGRWSVVWARPGVKRDVTLPLVGGVWNFPFGVAKELGVEVKVEAKIAQKALSEKPRYVMQLTTRTVEFDNEADATQKRAWYSARFGRDIEVEEVYEYRG